MLTTSTWAIKEFYPGFYPGWEQLLCRLGQKEASSTLFPLEWILDSNGLKQVLWLFRTLAGYHEAVALFACRAALLVLDMYERAYPEEGRARKALAAAEGFLRGKLSPETLDDFSEADFVCDHGPTGERGVLEASMALWCAFTATYGISWELRHTPPLLDIQGASPGDGIPWQADWDLNAELAAEAVDFALAALTASGRNNEDAGKYITAEVRRLCRLEGEYGTIPTSVLPSAL